MWYSMEEDPIFVEELHHPREVIFIGYRIIGKRMNQAHFLLL